ncbi:MAG: hypothetical protein QOE94_70 [Mycobacterium sp.]|nr:hypothetical protein [Mycobacterium sp.]
MTSGKRVQLPPVPELTDGPDLVLRLPLPGDMDDIVAQCRDPEFQRWTTVPVPYRESDAQEFLTRVAEGWRANVATFAIAHDGRFAGSVDLRFDGIGGAEVGFGLPGIEVVYWRAQVGNWASRRVAGRCGFRMEGTVRGLLEQRGERRDEPLTGQPDRSPHGD